MSELVLASKSPRRRELMKLLGYPFRSITSHADETMLPGEAPAEHVVRLAQRKAAEVAAQLDTGIVIGSDTVVVLDGDILGKPADEDEAFAMLSRLQGRTHTVFTGFALHDAADGRTFAGYETTEVTMRPMEADLIRRYIATEEPLDKAGSYGIQGYGAVLIPSIRGCYFNVMGLPLSRLMDALHLFTNGMYGYFGNKPESRL